MIDLVAVTLVHVVIAQEQRKCFLNSKATDDCSGTNVPLDLWVSTMGLSYFRGTDPTWCHSLWKHHWMSYCEVKSWMTAWVFKFVELYWQSVNGQPRFCLSRSPSEQCCLLLVAGLALAVPWSGRLVTAEAWFDSRSCPWGFVMEIVALGQVLFE